MSGEVCIWLNESDLNYIIDLLRHHTPERTKIINIHIFDYIPDFHVEPDESYIQTVYLPGHPKNPLSIKPNSSRKTPLIGKNPGKFSGEPINTLI